MIKEHDSRLHEGDLRFQKLTQLHEDMIEGQVEIKETASKIEKRLFIDNGTVSIQTKIDRHNNLLRGMMWAITSVSLVVSGVIVKLIISAILSHAAAGAPFSGPF